MKLKIIKTCFSFFHVLTMAVVLIGTVGGSVAYSQETTNHLLPTFNSDNVQLIENRSYCSTGFGTQGVAFRIEGKEVYSEKIGSIYSPGLDIYETPYVTIGCSFSKIFVDYSYFYNAIKFNKEVEYKNSTYNTIEFKLNSIALGYSFTFIDHYLHGDIGIGYSQVQYELGYDSSGSNEELNNSAPFYLVNIRFFISAYLYVNWYNQKAMGDDSVVSHVNKLGLNFLVKL
ncbi:hypothetical protein KJ966_22300 [bacterium]|nr:hypothetical protein [bacterium]